MDTRQVRREFIALARRLQRPGSGSTVGFLEGRSAWMRVPDLTGVLRPLSWAVVGAVAARLYMPERATQDLDIAVGAQDAAEARRRLAEAGFAHLGELSIGGSSWRSPEGVVVDVLEVSAGWFRQGLAEAADNRDAQGLPVLPLPYLVLMKFQAGRVQDLADVTRMLGQADGEAQAATRRLFARYARADVEDLESLIRLGQLEMQPPPADDGSVS